MTSGVPAVIPAGLTFATPGDWFTIRLPHESADASRIAAAAVADRPELARHQDAIRDLLHVLTEATRTLDIVAAYATVLDVAGGPLPATLVLAVRPMGEYTLDSIAAELAGHPDHGFPAPVTGTFDLPAGRTLRIERLAESPGPVPGGHPVSFIAQYVTRAEVGEVGEVGSGIAVMLTFSTPAVALADQLRQLFHQIACTMRFEAPESGEPVS